MSYSAFAKLKQHMEIETLKGLSLEQVNELLQSQHAKIENLKEVAIAMRTYIDAIPSDVAESFPAMPGFDRDWADGIIDT